MGMNSDAMSTATHSAIANIAPHAGCHGGVPAFASEIVPRTIFVLILRFLRAGLAAKQAPLHVRDALASGLDIFAAPVLLNVATVVARD